ncbi:LysE family translocator (plasmid) [Pseudomonas silvicola]|nr:LysE family translocator [Pseudomonas silvicola]
MNSAPAADKVAFIRLFRPGYFDARWQSKAILTWVAIMSVALKPDAAASTLPMIIAGCATICVLVFCGYALLFSTAVMAAFYRRIRRGLDALLACCFAVAGLKLVLWINERRCWRGGALADQGLFGAATVSLNVGF